MKVTEYRDDKSDLAGSILAHTDLSDYGYPLFRLSDIMRAPG